MLNRLIFWKSAARNSRKAEPETKRLRFGPVDPETIERLRRRAITNALERQG